MNLSIAIVGLGMIGGSIAQGLKRSLQPCPIIYALDRDELGLTAAKEQGAVDFLMHIPGPELLSADVVFLCTPVLQMEAVVTTIAPFLKPGAIVTDVGSTKGWLAPRMKSLLPVGVKYIGGHPMAGREKSGYFAADGELFRDKWYILTTDSATDQSALQVIRSLAESLGAKITVMEANLHDQCAAVISHTPHIAAAALVNLLDHYPDPQTSLQLAGGGFRDTTRIASSDADMWADICISNSTAILDSLESLQSILASLGQAIKAGDRAAIYGYFSSAKVHRDRMLSEMESKSPVVNLPRFPKNG